ncbi:phospholipase D-like domain-containing protein [Streptomyces sp. NBC_01565]|uniref:phospholipase D-like domain-containing protein n=1 Tax=Streptomyces sp. NBC_01565 TaxID=2975881 RepID=UPI00225BC308|nr:phospholipase D-like domain-containing protein [Streptomyces sp. NBC_01565]MCX4546188.1 phospholipase D-like domain-containing protein [Streptomyces sp. NBC_01565]
MTKINTATTTAAAAALLLACASAPVSAVETAPPSTPLVATGATFNDPTDPAAQNAIFTHISRLIDGAVPGSDIKISSYIFESDWLVERLGAAHRRGVNVEVILDSESPARKAGGVAYTKLDTALKAKTASSGTSWVRVCAQGQACLAKDPNPNDSFPSVNHNKFYLFSRTTGSATGTVPVDNVVVQTSANQTVWDREKAFNDALTVAGNKELYDAYAAYFTQQGAAQANPALQVSDLPNDTQAGPAKTYFFPRTTDVILNILNTVDNPVAGQPACYGNSAGYGTADGRTVIRIAMHQITRPEVAKKLWELDEAGCYVDIVYRKLDNTGTQIYDQLTKPTRFGGISLHQLDDDTTGGAATHSKYLLIEGTYKGLPDQKIVFTGSHPYTLSGLSNNDEALLKYDDTPRSPATTSPVYDAYRENFRNQRTHADQ